MVIYQTYFHSNIVFGGYCDVELCHLCVCAPGQRTELGVGRQGAPHCPRPEVELEGAHKQRVGVVQHLKHVRVGVPEMADKSILEAICMI